MPNYGFNPFTPRINLYTTGVDMGDYRRYHSRDVIRTTGERVDIDATLTPGEPGRREETEYEKRIATMARQQIEGSVDIRKRLHFVDGEEFRPLSDKLQGLHNLQEYTEIKEEENRREELSRYQLTEKEMDALLAYEKKSIEQSSSMVPLKIQAIYAKIQKKKEALHHCLNDKEDICQNLPLAQRVDWEIDEYFSLHNHGIENNANRVCKDTKDGIVRVGLPRVDRAVYLAKIDREYGSIGRESTSITSKDGSTMSHVQTIPSKKRKTVHLKEDSFLNVNISTKYEKEATSQVAAVTDEEISTHRMSEEELKKLPYYKNTASNSPCSMLYVKNMPKSTTKEELMALFDRNRRDDEAPIQCILLTGKMRGQAFIQYPSVDMATRALTSIHGFVYKGRPIIVQYKKN